MYIFLNSSDTYYFIHFIFFTVLIDLDQADEEWFKNEGPQHIKTIADHHGIYDHLFGDAYFLPRVPLHVVFSVGEGLIPVYYGNTIKPPEAVNEPQVSFHSDENSLWTLILTNPDGNFSDENGEYVHWFM